MSSYDAGTATARFVLDDSQLQAAAGQIEGTLNSLSTSFQGNYFGLSQLSRGFTELGGSMAAGLTLGVGAAVSWEQQMARLRALGTDLNATSAENKQALDGVVASLQQLASVTPVPINDLAAIATKLAQVGTAQADIVPLTKTIADFSLVTGASAENVITNFTRIQSIIGATQAQMPQFLNAMFVAFKETGVSVDQLFQNLNILGPVIAELQGTMHVTGAEAVFLASAMGNIPGQARQIRTAFVNLGADVGDALQKGGASLREVNTLLGTTDQSLRQAFESDPTRVVIQLTEALDKAAPTTEQLNTLLQGLGDKGKLVLPSIEAVVRSTSHLGATQQDAIQILDQLVAAYSRTTELQKATDQVTDTTAAHMTEFKNTLTVLEQTIGTGLLPAISGLVNFLSTLVSGFTALGPVVDTIVVGLAGLVGGILLIGGRIIAMVTQFVLARQAILAMKQAQDAKTKSDTDEAAAQEVATEATREHTAAIVEQGEAATRAKGQLAGLDAAGVGGGVAAGAGGAGVAEQQALFTAEGEVTTEANAATEAQLALFAAETQTGEGAQAEAAALTELGVVEDEVTTETTIMGTAMDVALGPIGLVVAAVGLLAGGLFLLGQHSRSATQDTVALQQAEQSLKGAIDSSSGSVEDSIRSSLESTLQTGRYATALQNLGLTADTVTNSILGDAAAQAAVQAAMQKGGADAKFLGDSIISLHDAILKELGVLQAKTAAQNADSNSTEENQKRQQALADAQQAAATKANTANAAMVDYVHALESVRDATFAAQDAQQKLKEAEEAVANEAGDAAKQQLEIESANLSAQKSTEQLADAQRAQAEAGQKASFDLQDAQFQLTDARLRASEADQSVVDKQKALTDAYNEGAQIANEVAKAENEIADARLREQESARAVQQAEYEINFLRGEGASAGDIENAELGLAKARQSGADAAQSVNDANQKLADLATKQADDIKKAQQALVAAYEERSKAVEEVAKATLNLHDVEADVNSGKAQRDADIAVQEAQIGVAKAHQQVADAEKNLQKIYDGSREEAVARAQNDLTKAYIGVADANSKLQIDLMKMNGQIVDSRVEANVYADALHKVAGEIGGPMGAAIDSIASKIRGVPIPPAVGPAMASGMDAAAAATKRGIDDVTNKLSGDYAHQLQVVRTVQDAIEARHKLGAINIGNITKDSGGNIVIQTEHYGTLTVQKWAEKLDELERKHEVSGKTVLITESIALDQLIQKHDFAGAQILIKTSGHQEELLQYMRTRWPKTNEIINQATDGWKKDIDETGINVVARAGKMSDDMNAALENRGHKPSKATMDAIRADLVDIVHQLGDQVAAGQTDAARRMAKAIDDAHPELHGAMERAVNDMANGANADQEGNKVGNDFIGGFINHLAQHGNDLLDSVRNLAEGVVKTFGDVLGISSPSKVTAEFGEYFTQGFAIGMLNHKQTLAEAAKILGSTALGALPSPAVVNSLGIGVGTGLGSGGSSSSQSQFESEMRDLVAAIEKLAENGGDNFHLTAVNGASAPQVADELMWRRWVRQ